MFNALHHAHVKTTNLVCVYIPLFQILLIKPEAMSNCFLRLQHCSTVSTCHICWCMQASAAQQQRAQLPVATAQVHEASQKSDSSSDPSDEVLDDPTNLALSQRPPAPLQSGQLVASHGDPLLSAAQAQTAAEPKQLPVRHMPSKQGVWKKKGKALPSCCNLLGMEAVLVYMIVTH